MALKLAIPLFSLCLVTTPSFACGQGLSLLDKDFTDDPSYFGKSSAFEYISGKELYLLPAENDWSFASYGRGDKNVDFCATVRSVEANTDSYAGLMFWRKDASNFSVFVARPDGAVVVDKMVDGKWQDIIARYDLLNFKGVGPLSTRLEVRIDGDEATFFADDVKLGSTNRPLPNDQGGDYGYIAGAGDKRSIFAISDPSITSTKSGVPTDVVSSVTESDGAADPQIDDIHTAIYKGLLKEGLGSNLPDGFSQDSIYGNAQSPFGVPEVVVDLKGSGMVSEFAYRFFKTKELATAYIGDDSKQPYIDELMKPGVLANFGWRHTKAGFDFPFVSAADPDNGQQWARALLQADNMMLLVTVAKKHPHIRMDAKVDEELVAQAGEMLSNALAGAKDAGIHYALFGISSNDQQPNTPKE